jgi:hypothetical protein
MTVQFCFAKGCAQHPCSGLHMSSHARPMQRAPHEPPCNNHAGGLRMSGRAAGSLKKAFHSSFGGAGPWRL